MTCGDDNNLSHWCNDPLTDALMAKAAADFFDQPAQAQKDWQAVYKEAVEQAAVVPFGRSTGAYVVSQRASANFRSSWPTGALLDQIWVRRSRRLTVGEDDRVSGPVLEHAFFHVSPDDAAAFEDGSPRHDW